MRLTFVPFLAVTVAALGGGLFGQKQAVGPNTKGSVEVQLPELLRVRATPELISFGAVEAYTSLQRTVEIGNFGFDLARVSRARFLLGSDGDSTAFSLDMAGRTLAGGPTDKVISFVPPIDLERGEVVSGTLTFAPVSEQFDSIDLVFEGNFGSVVVPLDGLGGHAGDPFLHVVIDGPKFVVDYDGDGSEPVVLDGFGSHTHEPGMSLSGYEWRQGPTLLGTSSGIKLQLPLGDHQIALTILDDDTPPKTLTDQHAVDVVGPSAVPGTLAYYYDAGAGDPAALLDAIPTDADYLERRDRFAVSASGNIGGSPFSSNTMVRLFGDFIIDVPGTYTFTPVGGRASRLELDGSPVAGPMALSAGIYELEARFALDGLSDGPLDVQVSMDAGPSDPIDEDQVTHDQSTLPPFINSLPSNGTSLGGNTVVIQGMGFFPSGAVTLHWGDDEFTEVDFQSVSSDEIVFITPPGGGPISVSVETLNGTSNVEVFTYDLDGPVPIGFTRTATLPIVCPTNGVWGTDHRLYVARLSGEIQAYEFDEDWNVVSQVTYPGVSGLTNKDLIGIAVNPYDPPSPMRLYLGHSEHYAQDGVTPTVAAPYSGQVSILEGPDFDTPVPLITGLPTSNHDHAVNSILFDHSGDLLVAVGSNTNSGVPTDAHGGTPESPLSAAILKAYTSRPGFNGAITYLETDGGAPNDDQRDGDIVDVAPGVDVEVYVSGTRNPYGMVLTTEGRLYAIDNGPNTAFGPASTGVATDTGVGVNDDDEILLLERGNYYGAPNRNRGRYDPRQNIWYASLTGPPSIPHVFTQMVGWTPPSSDGVIEYRADTFQGQIRGQFFIQEYQNKLRRVALSDDGRNMIANVSVPEPNPFALSVLQGPGGALITFDPTSNDMEIFEVDDLSAFGLIAHDITPWRGVPAGGTPFVIGGVGFGDLANTSVTIGGKAATLTEVTSKRIKGLIPAEASPTTDLLDVVVTVGTESDTLSEAFRYLIGEGQEPGRWDALPNMPATLGEVAAGEIDGILYVVGEGSGSTYAFDLLNRQWLPARPNRIYPGHHHAVEVFDGKLYVIGGIDGGAEGRVQIYDPQSNSWSLGANMFWGGGSLATALIDGKIYAGGGIVGMFTVGNMGVYDPVEDSWTPLEPMPDGGRNHAAAGTDGERFFLFGGRRQGNFPSNGYDTVMIYDPLTNTWETSDDEGSTLAPLPVMRGGMGTAIYMWDEFYVFGGETQDGPGALPGSNVYDRVDVYDPVANTWRVEKSMPNPRHGIYPVEFQGLVFLAGGGTNAGFSLSNLFDVFQRP